MDVFKKIIALIIVFSLISIGVTYLFFNYFKQTEIENIQNYYDDLIINMNNYTSYVESKNSNISLEIIETKDKLSDIQNQLEQKNNSLLQNITELELLKDGDYYDLHDPTYNEVVNFIENDKTNEEPYIENVFDCEQFSQLVNTNAENIGIRCAYVIIYFYDTDAGHGIIGFDTVDNGMVYIEPQTDEWVENLEEGYDYWTECIIPNGNYYYEESPNDTIKEILLFW